MTAHIYSLNPLMVPDRRRPGHTKKFRPMTLAGHRSAVTAAYWSADEEEIYTVSRDGACFVWRGKPDDENDDDEDDDDDMDVEEERNRAGPSRIESTAPAIATKRWGLATRHYFHAVSTNVVCTSFHAPTSLLVVGFASGTFGLYTMPECESLHTLSISSQRITTVCASADGAWLAFGCAGLGQLLVWEWASESYILKQQGHFYDMNTLSFSQDGQVAATGGDDGKVKLWNTSSGFCIATLSEHSAPVTAVEFAKQGNVLFSASLDGTVRAWDLVRYRNFRTMTTPRPVQFGCLSVESSGEVVCAGGGGGAAAADSFDIFMWSVQTGKLLDTLSGHDAPVSSIAFSPAGTGTLVSTSWDKSVRIWECFRRSAAVDPLVLNADGLAIAYRHDGQEVCVATLDGQLAFFDPRDGGRQTGLLECRRDIAAGRRLDDKVSRKAAAGSSCFTTVTYSADGSCILAGGNSNWVCLYDVGEKVLLKRWQLSQDLSLDGTQDRLDTRRLAAVDGRPIDLVDDFSDEDELTVAERADRSLPGAQRGDLSRRTTRAITRSKAVRFSPTGRTFAAASTAGLVLFSLDAAGQAVFDPLDLDIDLTPESVRDLLAAGDALAALVGALRLGEVALLDEVYERIGVADIGLVVRQLPEAHLAAVLQLVVRRARASPHLEYHLLWVRAIFGVHGQKLREQAGTGRYAPVLRSLQGVLNEVGANVKRTADENRHAMLYLWQAMR